MRPMVRINDGFEARIDHETSRAKGPYLDGDTVVGALHVPKLRIVRNDAWFRFLGVDTKEVTGPEREDGLVAARFTKEWLEEASTNGYAYYLAVDIWKLDSFGRFLVWLWNRLTGECLNDVLVEKGFSAYVNPYAMMRSDFWETRREREVFPLAA